MSHGPELQMRVKVVQAWWLGPYLSALAFFCVLMRREPNWEKVNRIVCRGVSARLEP